MNLKSVAIFAAAYALAVFAVAFIGVLVLPEKAAGLCVFICGFGSIAMLISAFSLPAGSFNRLDAALLYLVMLVVSSVSLLVPATSPDDSLNGFGGPISVLAAGPVFALITIVFPIIRKRCRDRTDQDPA